MEDFHHVLLRIGYCRICTGGASGSIGRDVEWFVVVEELEDVAVWWGCDDGGGDELIHCFMVRRMGGIVEETGAGCVSSARQEGETDGTVVGDSLESAD